MIYHLLTEAEPFSEVTGGAISRWVANVIRKSDSRVVCPSFDGSWGYSPGRVITLPHFNDRSVARKIVSRISFCSRTLGLDLFSPLLRMAQPGDTIWVHNRPEYAAALADRSLMRGVQVVLHMHNSHLTRLGSGFRGLESVTPVFCSHFLAEEARHCGVSMRQGYVLRNGVDPELFHPAPLSEAKTVEIAFAGRLVPEKGAHVLVDAMRVLYEEGIDARCAIIGAAGFGTNTTSDYVRRLEATLPSNTEMIGYLSGARYAARLREASVFCCPSTWEEPFGMVIVEAMASGLPVVASASGGIPEILRNGGGFLVEPSNPVALAAELKRLVLDQQLRMHMKAEAIKTIKTHFTWDIIRQHYTRIADEVTRCGDMHKAPLLETPASC
jgi:spore coat protein SA